jgi:hypothetical protein
LETLKTEGLLVFQEGEPALDFGTGVVKVSSFIGITEHGLDRFALKHDPLTGEYRKVFNGLTKLGFDAETAKTLIAEKLKETTN